MERFAADVHFLLEVKVAEVKPEEILELTKLICGLNQFVESDKKPILWECVFEICECQLISSAGLVVPRDRPFTSNRTEFLATGSFLLRFGHFTPESSVYSGNNPVNWIS